MGFFESNLSSLGLPPRSRQAVEAATPRGRVEGRADGSRVLCVGDQVLDPPMDVLRAAELQREVEAFDGPAMVFGAGLGYQVSQVTHRTNRPVVVYEPDPGLLRTALEHGPLSFGGAIVVCDLEDLESIHLGSARSVLALVCAGYGELCPDDVATFREVSSRLVARHHVEGNTIRHKAREWFECLAENAWAIRERPTAMSLAGQFRNVPAFVVAPGPSLTNNVELLEEARSKGLLLCVNSAGKALARAGVAPHFLMSLESNDISSVFEALPFIDDVIRAFSLIGHPAVLRTGKGPLLPIFSVTPELQSLEELTGRRGLNVAASVSTAAFSLAELMGCNPIVLVGHDLAFTGGRVYAPGTGLKADAVIEKAEDGNFRVRYPTAGSQSLNQPLRVVEAWGGAGAIETGTVYGIVLDWFARRALNRDQELRTARLINATEGGARIPGWDELTLREVLDDHAPRGLEVADILARVPAASQRTAADLEAWADRHGAGAAAVREAANAVAKTAERAIRAMSTGQPGLVTRVLRELEVAEQVMREAVAAERMVDAWAMAAVDDAIREARGKEADDEEAEARRAVEREIRVARAVEAAARELESLLQRIPGSSPSP